MPSAGTSRQLVLFRALVAGTSISAFGSYLNMVALNLFVFQATGSALQTGGFMALRLGAGFVAGMFGGTVADRLPRRPVMVACDLAQAAALVALVLAPSSVRLGLVPLVAVATGLLGTTSTVLLRSSVPDLVGAADRVRANGLLVTGRAIAMALGFAAGGVLVGWWGYRGAFLVDAGTFVVSAALLAVLPLPFPSRRSRAAAPAKAAGDGGLRRHRRAIAAALVAAPVIGVFVLVRAVDALGSAAHNVGMPVYATEVRPQDPAAFVGQFFAVWAVGLFAAHQVVRRLGTGRSGLDAPRRSESGFIVGTCLMSAAFIVAFTDLPGGWILLVAFVAGAADGFTEITYTTRLQAEPEPQRGWFFGLTAMAENGGLGLGMLLAAGLLEVWRPLHVAASMHGAVIVLALGVVLFGLLRRRPTGDVPAPSGNIPAAGDPDPGGNVPAAGGGGPAPGNGVSGPPAHDLTPAEGNRP